jgi:hypothetical protein
LARPSSRFAFFQDGRWQVLDNSALAFGDPTTHLHFHHCMESIMYHLGLLLATFAWQTMVPVQPAPSISRVAWLAGCWEANRGSRTIQEHWMAPLGNTMVSVGRTVRGDSLTEFELVIIRAGGSSLAYEAHPSGQAPTVFLATTVTERSVVFENRQHDFPQQVAYERRGADSLLAWISGPMTGQTRRIEFPYVRVKCQ